MILWWTILEFHQGNYFLGFPLFMADLNHVQRKIQIEKEPGSSPVETSLLGLFLRRSRISETMMKYVLLFNYNIVISKFITNIHRLGWLQPPPPPPYNFSSGHILAKTVIYGQALEKNIPAGDLSPRSPPPPPR